jgi:hypothetical protein
MNLEQQAVQVLIIIGIVAVIIVAAILGQMAVKKRRDAVMVLAARLGLQFEPDTNRDLARRF